MLTFILHPILPDFMAFAQENYFKLCVKTAETTFLTMIHLYSDAELPFSKKTVLDL